MNRQINTKRFTLKMVQNTISRDGKGRIPEQSYEFCAQSGMNTPRADRKISVPINLTEHHNKEVWKSAPSVPVSGYNK
jgi:hypothetical protein